MAKLDMRNIHKKLQEAGSILVDTIGIEQAKEYLQTFDKAEKYLKKYRKQIDGFKYQLGQQIAINTQLQSEIQKKNDLVNGLLMANKGR